MSIGTKRDLLLDDDNDLVITSDLSLTSGLASMRQAVRVALQFFQGEWFLDTTVGLPWYQSVLVKNPNPAVLKSVFRACITGVQGIKSLDSLDLVYDRPSRILSVNFTATCDFGVFDDSVTLGAP